MAQTCRERDSWTTKSRIRRICGKRNSPAGQAWPGYTMAGFLRRVTSGVRRFPLARLNRELGTSKNLTANWRPANHVYNQEPDVCIEVLYDLRSQRIWERNSSFPKSRGICTRTPLIKSPWKHLDPFSTQYCIKQRCDVLVLKLQLVWGFKKVVR